ncbi:hypothetical protein AB833_27305 [Chromatiales bacterium (ex Bugula neritina AB1)]|nr:hypothetical protein AB833_27305 [Chromatiales bacterium (ex Bugula neritina AB1)]
MLILISPAKTLDYETPPQIDETTQPQFLEHSQELVNQLSKMPAAKIGKLMHISDKLADLNTQRYKSWQLPLKPGAAKQCLFAFQGDVYIGLDAASMKKRDVNFAQKHLRILSGLYGVLRPLDLMLPYRLEMGTKLVNKRGQNLYQFWGDNITESLNAEATTSKKPLIVNLASNEYFKVVNRQKLNGRLISPVFKDMKNGEYKLISFFAKKARGMMARYIIDNRIKSAAALKNFNTAGYAYNEELSRENEPVFTRDAAG